MRNWLQRTSALHIPDGRWSAIHPARHRRPLAILAPCLCLLAGAASASTPPLAGDVAAALRSHRLYVQPSMSRVLGSGAQAKIRQAIAHSTFSPGQAPVVAVLETLPVGYDSPLQFAHALSDLHITSGAAAVVIPHKVAAYSDAVAPAKMDAIQQESVPYFRRSIESGLTFLVPALAAAGTPRALASTPPSPPSPAPAQNSHAGAVLAGGSPAANPPAAPAPEPSTRSSAVIGWVLVAVAAFVGFAWMRRRKGDLSSRKTGLTDFGYTVSEKVRQIDDLLPQVPDSPARQKALDLRQQAGSAFSEGMQTLSQPLTAETLDSAQASLRRADGLLEQAQQQVNSVGTAPSSRP